MLSQVAFLLCMASSYGLRVPIDNLKDSKFGGEQELEDASSAPINFAVKVGVEKPADLDFKPKEAIVTVNGNVEKAVFQFPSSVTPMTAVKTTNGNMEKTVCTNTKKKMDIWELEKIKTEDEEKFTLKLGSLEKLNKKEKFFVKKTVIRSLPDMKSGVDGLMATWNEYSKQGLKGQVSFTKTITKHGDKKTFPQVGDRVAIRMQGLGKDPMKNYHDTKYNTIFQYQFKKLDKDFKAMMGQTGDIASMEDSVARTSMGETIVLNMSFSPKPLRINAEQTWELQDQITEMEVQSVTRAAKVDFSKRASSSLPADEQIALEKVDLKSSTDQDLVMPFTHMKLHRKTTKLGDLKTYVTKGKTVTMRMAGSKSSKDAGETRYDTTMEFEYPMLAKPYRIMPNFPFVKFGLDELLLPNMTMGQRQTLTSDTMEFMMWGKKREFTPPPFELELLNII